MFAEETENYVPDRKRLGRHFHHFHVTQVALGDWDPHKP